MFTLSGAHIFPLYDAAVGGKAGLTDGWPTGSPKLIDVRHEQTAVFAAEAISKLTRKPGFAALTAGPGVTNGISAISQAFYNASPMVVIGGRAPAYRWGSGALQELDHPALLGPITKEARTLGTLGEIYAGVTNAFATASAPHRGPVFVDIPMDALFAQDEIPMLEPAAPVDRSPKSGEIANIVDVLREAHAPVVVVGTDVWADRAEASVKRMCESLDLPVIANGMGRGVLPPTSEQLVTRARSMAFSQADLVIVIGAPLDFRLNYGAFGGRDGNPPAKVVHIADSEDQIAKHVSLSAFASGDLSEIANALSEAFGASEEKRDEARRAGDARAPWAKWRAQLRQAHASAQASDAADLTNESNPIHPARIYGELNKRLADDAVVIGDGGDFVSFAGRYVEPALPGNWLDPGPFGCLGTACGYAMAARLARPGAQVVALLGDGALGFSMGDLESLVRHQLPVVMVMGNNGIWALERGPMRKLYEYDVIAELRPEIRYHEVLEALDGAGEVVKAPGEIGAALDRAFAADRPYLVNVITDPDVEYPRSTLGV